MKNRTISFLFYGLCSILLVFLLKIIFIDLKQDNDEEKAPFYINEVCTNNFSCLYDFQSNSYSDWIEIYNVSEEKQSLKGYIIEKNRNSKSRMVLGDLEVGANSYIVIYCNDIGGEVASAPFKLSAQGVSISLLNPFEMIVDEVEVPALEYNTCFSRIEDGKNDWDILTPTPYQSNVCAEKVLDTYIDKPVFSLENGFYEEEIQLEIETKKNKDIYYTTDGSIPTADSFHYEEPIILKDPSDKENIFNNISNVCRDPSAYVLPDTVDKVNIIRAAVFDKSERVSDISTGVFFVGKKYEDVCVMSLVTDPDNLFDSEKGIYVTGKEWDEWYQNGEEGDEPDRNWDRTGRESEVGAVMDFWDEEGNHICSQDIGMRIQGNTTRKIPRKRLNIFSRKEYSGNDFFTGDLFQNGRAVHSITLFDSYQNMYMSKLMADRNIGSQSGKKCLVFLDGEYWYTYYMMERIDDRFISQKYNINVDNIVMIKNGDINTSNYNDEISYQEMQDFILNADFSDIDAYNKLDEMVDIQNLCDYLATIIYFSDLDHRIENNDVIWKSREISNKLYEDGKWRWVINDSDKIFWLLPQEDSFNSQLVLREETYLTSQYLPNLLRSGLFKQRFAITLLDMANSVFKPENAVTLLEQEEIYDERAKYFLYERFPYAMNNLKDALDIEGNIVTLYVKSVGISEADIELNTITISTSQEDAWIGQYFSDYPVRLSVKTQDASRFLGWRINNNTQLITDNEIELFLDRKEVSVEAIFK